MTSLTYCLSGVTIAIKSEKETKQSGDKLAPSFHTGRYTNRLGFLPMDRPWSDITKSLNDKAKTCNAMKDKSGNLLTEDSRPR